MDHYRTPARRELPAGRGVDVLEPDARLAPGALDGLGEADPRSELAGCLRSLMDHLSPRHREAITLTEVEGLTQAAAAARLGMSVSGMKTRVQRARRQLKALLLDCCQVQLDRRGGVMGYRVRGRAPWATASGVVLVVRARLLLTACAVASARIPGSGGERPHRGHPAERAAQRAGRDQRHPRTFLCGCQHRPTAAQVELAASGAADGCVLVAAVPSV